MNERQYALKIVSAIIAGLVGGVIANQLLVGQPVFAERAQRPIKVVVAEEFRLVGKDGRTRATLGLFPAMRLGFPSPLKPQVLFWEEEDVLPSMYGARALELFDV